MSNSVLPSVKNSTHSDNIISTQQTSKLTESNESRVKGDARRRRIVSSNDLRHTNNASQDNSNVIRSSQEKRDRKNRNEDYHERAWPASKGFQRDSSGQKQFRHLPRIAVQNHGNLPSKPIPRDKLPSMNRRSSVQRSEPRPKDDSNWERPASYRSPKASKPPTKPLLSHRGPPPKVGRSHIPSQGQNHYRFNNLSYSSDRFQGLPPRSQPVHITRPSTRRIENPRLKLAKPPSNWPLDKPAPIPEGPPPDEISNESKIQLIANERGKDFQYLHQKSQRNRRNSFGSQTRNIQPPDRRPATTFTDSRGFMTKHWDDVAQRSFYHNTLTGEKHWQEEHTVHVPMTVSSIHVDSLNNNIRSLQHRLRPAQYNPRHTSNRTSSRTSSRSSKRRQRKQESRKRTNQCRVCGYQCKPDAMYCTACGCPQFRHCTSCGNKVKSAIALYCDVCGNNILPISENIDRSFTIDVKNNRSNQRQSLDQHSIRERLPYRSKHIDVIGSIPENSYGQHIGARKSHDNLNDRRSRQNQANSEYNTVEWGDNDDRKSVASHKSNMDDRNRIHSQEHYQRKMTGRNSFQENSMGYSRQFRQFNHNDAYGDDDRSNISDIYEIPSEFVKSSRDFNEGSQSRISNNIDYSRQPMWHLNPMMKPERSQRKGFIRTAMGRWRKLRTWFRGREHKRMTQSEAPLQNMDILRNSNHLPDNPPEFINTRRDYNPMNSVETITSSSEEVDETYLEEFKEPSTSIISIDQDDNSSEVTERRNTSTKAKMSLKIYHGLVSSNENKNSDSESIDELTSTFDRDEYNSSGSDSIGLEYKTMPPTQKTLLSPSKPPTQKTLLSPSKRLVKQNTPLLSPSKRMVSSPSKRRINAFSERPQSPSVRVAAARAATRQTSSSDGQEKNSGVNIKRDGPNNSGDIDGTPSVVTALYSPSIKTAASAAAKRTTSRSNDRRRQSSLSTVEQTQNNLDIDEDAVDKPQPRTSVYFSEDQDDEVKERVKKWKDDSDFDSTSHAKWRAQARNQSTREQTRIDAPLSPKKGGENGPTRTGKMTPLPPPTPTPHLRKTAREKYIQGTSASVSIHENGVKERHVEDPILVGALQGTSLAKSIGETSKYSFSSKDVFDHQSRPDRYSSTHKNNDWLTSSSCDSSSSEGRT